MGTNAYATTLDGLSGLLFTPVPVVAVFAVAPAVVHIFWRLCESSILWSQLTGAHPQVRAKVDKIQFDEFEERNFVEREVAGQDEKLKGGEDKQRGCKEDHQSDDEKCDPFP